MNESNMMSLPQQCECRCAISLEAAESLWKTEHDVAEVEHLAYITEKRVEIARVTAQRRLVADEIQQSRTPRP